jgi:hypothetical protein
MSGSAATGSGGGSGSEGRDTIPWSCWDGDTTLGVGRAGGELVSSAMIRRIEAKISSIEGSGTLAVLDMAENAPKFAYPHENQRGRIVTEY